MYIYIFIFQTFQTKLDFFPQKHTIGSIFGKKCNPPYLQGEENYDLLYIWRKRIY